MILKGTSFSPSSFCIIPLVFIILFQSETSIQQEKENIHFL